MSMKMCNNRKWFFAIILCCLLPFAYAYAQDGVEIVAYPTIDTESVRLFSTNNHIYLRTASKLWQMDNLKWNEVETAFAPDDTSIPQSNIKEIYPWIDGIVQLDSSAYIVSNMNRLYEYNTETDQFAFIMSINEVSCFNYFPQLAIANNRVYVLDNYRARVMEIDLSVFAAHPQRILRIAIVGDVPIGNAALGRTIDAYTRRDRNVSIDVQNETMDNITRSINEYDILACGTDV